MTHAFYHIDLAYGGPEEGGWYYQTGRLIRRARRTYTPEQIARLNNLLDNLQDRARIPQISSVASRGRTRLLRYQGDHFPLRRPHYE